MRRLLCTALTATVIATVCLPASASDTSGTPAFSRVERIGLPDGSAIIVGSDGLGARIDATGRIIHATNVVRPVGFRSVAGDDGPGHLALAERFATQRGRAYPPGEILVIFRDGFDGRALRSTLQSRDIAHAAVFGDRVLIDTLRSAKARSLEPLFSRFASAQLAQLTQTARRSESSAKPLPALEQAYLLHIAAGSPPAVARALLASPDVSYAEPNYYVGTFATDPKEIPVSQQERAQRMAMSLRYAPPFASPQRVSNKVALPSNYGLQSSLQSYLNASSIDAVPPYASLDAHGGQLPGQGERITNVSIGDLTDESMAQHGDTYVQYYGPTTVIQGNQRYLDIPSFPLIPTYTSDMSGNLDPLGSVEGADPYLSEVLLDFSVMAPLPDDRQRAGEHGSGLTDLLGIAPGASYRLVVPDQPTIANVDVAMLGAAVQSPRPDVISASIGFGTDNVGFPGRYLEDDPLAHAVITSIVNEYDIVVSVAANDGTRIYTNAAVNPDGGSTPTDVAAAGAPITDIADDSLSTTPSELHDSGGIAVGGSTLDDILAAPPEDGGTLSHQIAFPETRIDGATDFSSGFGSRVNLSAPSDNIPTMIHECACDSPSAGASSVIPVLNGGTSAAAPAIAASAAVILQAARLAGKSLTPLQVRDLLVRTARTLPNPPQLDTTVAVGPQVDLGAAVEALLPATAGHSSPRVLRLAVAERQDLGSLGAEFQENTDPSQIDLMGPVYGSTPSGQNQVSPITIAPDWYGLPNGAHYELYVTGQPHKILATTPWARVMPRQILQISGLPFVSGSSRSATLTYAAYAGKHELSAVTFTLVFSANTGAYLESLAPSVPGTVSTDQSVTVGYDLSNVNGLQNPQLLVSSIGHWSPLTAPYFRIAYSVALTKPRGSITIPAKVFAAGAGIYGVGIETNSLQRIVGRFAAFRVKPGGIARPAAPTLTTALSVPAGHTLAVTRGASSFMVDYDVSMIPHATGAMLELSAPGPTLASLENVFENAFGSTRDDNGVDTASVVYRPLGGVKGRTTLEASKLGLTSSLLYNVRVLATAGGRVVGEASPVSTLEFNDTLTPGDAFITAFDIMPSGTTSVSTLSLDANNFVTDSALFPYTAGKEVYGNALLDDPSGKTQYSVMGSDAKLGQIGVLSYAAGPSSGSATNAIQNLLALNATSGSILATIPLAGGTAQIIGGRVDGQRHRAAVLQYEFGSTGSTVLPINLTTDTAGTAISAGTRSFAHAGQPNTIDLDPSTGLLYLTARNEGTNCVIAPSAVESIDPGSGTISTPFALPACISGLVSDQAGKALYFTKGTLSTYGPGLAPFPSLVLDVTESPMQLANTIQLKDRACFMPAVDSTAHLTIVGCIAPEDDLVNNAAMSVIDVINQSTGAIAERIPTFDFAYAAESGIPYIDRGIQVDPTTRTGWTFAPSGDALQQFKY